MVELNAPTLNLIGVIAFIKPSAAVIALHTELILDRDFPPVKEGFDGEQRRNYLEATKLGIGSDCMGWNEELEAVVQKKLATRRYFQAR